MLSSLFRCAGLACAVMVVLTPMWAGDTAPPVLTSFNFPPNPIDTRSTAATLTVVSTVTDNESGMNGSVCIEFISPAHNQFRNGCGTVCTTGSLSCTSTAQIAFPQYGEAGMWTVYRVWTSDTVGNFMEYNADSLKDAGLPWSVEVLSNPDATPPVLTQFTFSPDPLDTTAGPATMHFNFTATDQPAGMTNSICVELVSPSRKQYRAGCTYPCAAGSSTCAGTADVLFPQYGEAGEWTVLRVWGYDVAGNLMQYMTEALAAADFSTTFTVNSIQDTTAPVLTAFAFTPNPIDTNVGPVTLAVDSGVRDDLSGMQGSVCVEFTSPSRAQYRASCGTPCAVGSLTCASPMEVAFPQFGESGIWTAYRVWTSDVAGNWMEYSSATLNAAGFPSKLLDTHESVSELLFINASATPVSTKGRGTTIRLQALVHNIGNLPASKAQASFAYSTDGGLTYSELGTAKLGTLAPGATGVAAYTWRAAAGSYMIRVTLDPGNHIVEFDETNNEAIVQLTVP